jgi:hypothetical protein
VYRQCLQQVSDKLKSTENWEVMQKEQSLHNLISKVGKICVGFDDHKQEVFNLVQALRAFFSVHAEQEELCGGIRVKL